MSEISLICPRCAAQYRLPAAAIPAAGREVECSACAHVWHARPDAPPRLDLGAFPASAPDEATAPAPQPAPQPSRRLPPNVLSILREEAERERQLRQAEAATPAITTPDPTAATPAEAADWPEWPATTVTLPATGTARTVIAQPLPQPQPRPQPQPPLAERMPDAAARPQPALPEPDLSEPAPQVIRHSTQPATGTPPQAGPSRAGYRAGFGLAVMAAACCVALYLLAPGLAEGDSPFGQQLMDLRHEVDRGRLWLQDQARALTG